MANKMLSVLVMGTVSLAFATIGQFYAWPFWLCSGWVGSLASTAFVLSGNAQNDLKIGDRAPFSGSTQRFPQTGVCHLIGRRRGERRCGDQTYRSKPMMQRDMARLEDRADGHRKWLPAPIAFMEARSGPTAEFAGAAVGAASRTDWAVRP